MSSAGNFFRIVEGVRRAKAFQLCGIAAIRAEILNLDGTSGGFINVSIDDLRSPKNEIDISTPQMAKRFWKIHNLVQQGRGARLRPIIITPGSRGVLVNDIRLRY